MTLEEFFELKALDMARTTYVVLAEDVNGNRILLQDPGMDRPWSSKNRKLADSHAQEIERSRQYRKAAAVTLEEAFTILQQQFAKSRRRK